MPEDTTQEDYAKTIDALQYGLGCVSVRRF